MLAFNLTANNFWLLLAGNLTVQPDQNFGLRRQTNNFFEKIMTRIFFLSKRFNLMLNGEKLFDGFQSFGTTQFSFCVTLS